MEKDGAMLMPDALDITSNVKVLIVRIDGQHVFAHDITYEPCPAEAIERCTNFYRHQERFANSHLRFDVLEVTAVPARDLSA
ncbi:MAG TPA: hypothetical protein VII47_09220 [Actinomycetota bacterium]|jgi:hypothetical protein